MVFQTVLKVKRLFPVAFTALPLLLAALPAVAYPTAQADLAYALEKQENKPVVEKAKNEGALQVIGESEESAFIDLVLTVGQLFEISNRVLYNPS